jgi:hypothetical protein
MGLDITAYKKAVLVEPLSLKQRREAQDAHPLDASHEHTFLYQDGFEKQRDGFKDGFYKVEGKDFRFRAGSYSGYNAWRRQLCEMVCGKEPSDVWDGKVEPPAFGELIHFSDCEGFIGPKTSAKLAKDFDEWRDGAKLYAQTLSVDERQWFLALYDEWSQAFHLAAETGVVAFH